MQKFFWVGSLILFAGMVPFSGCAGTSKPVEKIAKPVDATAANLVKVRELRDTAGETRAIVSPADERQLRITF